MTEETPIAGIIDEWDGALTSRFGFVVVTAAFGPPALRINAQDMATGNYETILTVEQALALSRWLEEVALAHQAHTTGKARKPTVMVLEDIAERLRTIADWHEANWDKP